MYYRVKEHLRDIPNDHHFFGFETEYDFRTAVHNRHQKWKGAVGRCVDERPDRRCLRIYNIYSSYEDVWFYDFMLEQTVPPAEEREESSDIDEVLDKIFGFD